MLAGMNHNRDCHNSRRPRAVTDLAGTWLEGIEIEGRLMPPLGHGGPAGTLSGCCCFSSPVWP